VEVNRREFFGLGAVGTAGTLGASTALGFGTGEARTVEQEMRIQDADEHHSLCPYCAVGCAFNAYTRTDDDGHVQLLQIEGDPDSPVNEGRLCPKGATALELATSPRRVASPRKRSAGSDTWEDISWDQALDEIARHIKDSRDETFVTEDGDGNTVNRCEGIAFAGGAAFSSEEGFLAVKMLRSLGVTHIEQQARV
jgi:formate dehydrogenase major subunit